MSIWSRLANALHPNRLDRDLDEELRLHAEERARELVAKGLAPDDARREAHRRLGNRLHLRERSRDVKVTAWLESAVRDLRHALRRLRRDSLVNGAAIASIGLALGACLAAFSLVDALILRSLPVRAPERLVYLTFPSEAAEPVETDRFNYPLFERLRVGARDRVDLFAVSTQVMRPAVFDPATGAREAVRTQYVGGDAFALLGVAPATGRVIGPDDDRTPGASPIAVLSHAFWSRRFGGDPNVVGRWFTLEGTQLQIVGVAERGFSGVEPGRPTDVWLPTMMYTTRAFENPTFNWFRTFGRLRAGVSPATATAAVQAAFTSYRRDRAERFAGSRTDEALARFIAASVELRSAATGPSPLRQQFAPALWVLAATAVLILCVAGSNVANLLLARSAARERETSLRLAIGAGRARLVQQGVIESVVMAALASGLGIVLARVVAVRIVSMLSSAGEPIALDLGMDLRFVLIAVGLLGITAVIFGLVPTLHASFATPMAALRAGDRRAGARSTTMRPFIAAQVAFSMVVLFVGGLLMLSFERLSGSDPGFEASRIVMLGVESSGTADESSNRSALFEAADRLRRLPGVEAVSLAENGLLGRTWTMTAPVTGGGREGLEVTLAPVGDGYFETLGIPLRTGRTFTRADMNIDASTALVVNEAFVRLSLGGGEALGRVVEGPFGGQFGRNVGRSGQIVGVVGDTKHDLRENPAPAIYMPLRTQATIYVRWADRSAVFDGRLRDEVHTSTSLLRVTSITPLSAAIEETLVRERLLALLSSFFAGGGLVMVGVGLYGVLSYTVVERTREIGIRMALGAQPRTVVRRMLTDSALVIMAGAAFGLGVGVNTARYLDTVLFDVGPMDLSSLALPVGVLVLTSVGALAAPAWRASHVDPVLALRHD